MINHPKKKAISLADIEANPEMVIHAEASLGRAALFTHLQERTYKLPPIREAARTGDIDALQQALEKAKIENPAAINEKDLSGNTPLFNAIGLRNQACANLLLDYGADPNLLSNNGQTILHPLVKPGPKETDPEWFRALCSKVSPATLNGQDSLTKVAPIHMAAAYKNELLALLMEAGADVNIQDKAGETPLHYIICKYGSKELSTEKKADVQKGVALLCGQPGIDINCTEHQKQTPLHLAVQTRHKEVASELIARGARGNITSEKQKKTVHQLLCNSEWEGAGDLLGQLVKRNYRAKWVMHHERIVDVQTEE